ncbi:hypothetical protein HMPREF0645_2343 [Hallella bergensis DSM 17361]|uniref:Uncharacterized protein n=1 Tax=Hallella bergensis DSM 17361 TaxID=585502 RepID=D1PZF8_9BACT|nr:hypothetical protein [Hallella bergensis]EFA43227.1 hypothetical protein HMPREF0645_2343 [Hallella bergensis DSM 17361]
MKPKLHLDWKKALLFLVVSAGLIYITKSIWMSIGIVLLLFVVDSLLADWEYRRRVKKTFTELRKAREEEEKKKKKQP